ncbi:MAG: fructose-6-phosphate aldolase [Nitrospinota bacterium]
MKIFIDSADINEIIEAASFNAIDGVTTNPSLIAKTGRGFKEVLAEIIEVVDGPISAEVISQDSAGMVKEGLDLAKLSENIVVKIPITVEGLKAVKILSNDNIKTNVTLVFSQLQAILAAKAGATYLSPFVGRLDDISVDGLEIVDDILTIYSNYEYQTEVIVASIRHPMHVLESARLGADVATIPLFVIKALVNHPLTDIGLKQFLDDWKKVPEK